MTATIGATDRSSASTAPALVVSSDGHAVAEMPAYREYLPSSLHAEFDEFCKVHAVEGLRTIEPESLLQRTDQDVVEQWIESVIETDRLGGQSDPAKRLVELDREGIAAEVLFSDFGLAFELYPPLIAAIRGYRRDPRHVEAGNKAHNRWLADFCRESPKRFAGLAVLSFADVDDTVAEIRRAKQDGLRGIVLPAASEDRPFFHQSFEPIWNVLEELEMPVTTHTAISSITDHVATGTLKAVPHPACAAPLMTAQVFFFTQQILGHFIWSGLLERHPKLQLVMTEQGSGWVVAALTGMDYSWERSYLRRDIREVVPRPPSDYFRRQVHLGSSLFSRAEAENRRQIGVDKMMIGADYPHHEGTWGAGPGQREWLRATLGAANVPADEARLMLGENAVRLWQLDRDVLVDVAARIGPTMGEILTPPTDEFFPRGDIHKPLTSAW